MKRPEIWVPRGLGAHPRASGTVFRVFSTEAKVVEVQIYSAPDVKGERRALRLVADHTFELEWPGITAGALYQFIVDGETRPDPFAHFLPFGVHGPAEVIEPDYSYRCDAPPPPASRVIYEIHVGTFTKEGTYRAAERHLEELRELGITTIELMPLAAFPGRHGWGYDGVAGFAPFAPYGRPEDLKHFIDTAHGLGLEVLLDVVYNHFGPDGNYLGAYSSRYFDPDIETPWGQAPRFTDPAMRSYALESALYWLGEYRFDGLRFDACHQIHDSSPLHIIGEIREQARSRAEYFFVAEDERNDPRELERMGVDAVWADDFHHVVHCLLTGEKDGYYAAYAPEPSQLARVIERGFLYEGQPFVDGSPRGQPADRMAPESFIYCLQNHDQVGNRPWGSRLHHVCDPSSYRAASALLLFLPMTPLLFMGQEWAASSPFCYFTDHEPQLGKAVSEGRRKEFASFTKFKGTEIPDPQAESTFKKSQVDWDERTQEGHREVLDLYRGLLELRRHDPVLSKPGVREDLKAEVNEDALVVRRRAGAEERIFVWNFGTARPVSDFPVGALLLATEPLEEGYLAGHSAAIFRGAERH